MIIMLGTVGTAETVEILRAYIDNSRLCSSAITAIKQSTGERS